ncbi:MULTISPECIES: hypothetical protein [Nonomuraea]|uniref:Uncharacterized protein n=1 Tax=Nonomuraea mangrovi TaxID=2316207 RepID=A0ABW4SPQ2_9ACTN
MKDIIIPGMVMVTLGVVALGCMEFYFRLVRQRAETAAEERYRELADQTNARLTELTSRVAAVEQLLRSVD